MTTRLDAIRQREQAATPGPWYSEPASSVLSARVGAEGHLRGVGDYAFAFLDDSSRPEQGGAEWDAPFIAHARADIPALLAVVEAAGAFMSRWDDRTYIDASDMVGHCWESIDALRAALAHLLEPEP